MLRSTAVDGHCLLLLPAGRERDDAAQRQPTSGTNDIDSAVASMLQPSARSIFLQRVPLSLHEAVCSALRLTTFQCLESINLSHSKLTALPSLAPACGTTLRNVDLSYNALTDAECIRDCTVLRSAFLHGNRISRLAAVGHVLGSLSSLETLTLYENGCTQLRDASSPGDDSVPRRSAADEEDAIAGLPSRAQLMNTPSLRIAKIKALTTEIFAECSKAGVGDSPQDLACLYLAARAAGGSLKRLILSSPSACPGVARAGRGAVAIADGGVGVDVTPLMVAACIADITPSFAQAAAAWAITPFAGVYAEQVGEEHVAAAWRHVFAAGSPRAAAAVPAVKSNPTPPPVPAFTLTRARSTDAPPEVAQSITARRATKVLHDATRARKKAASEAVDEKATARARATAFAAAANAANMKRMPTKRGGNAVMPDAEAEKAFTKDPEARRISQRMALPSGHRLSTHVSMNPFTPDLSISPSAVAAAADEPGADYARAPEEVEPSEAAACEEGYRVTFSGRVMKRSDGDGSVPLDGADGTVALRVRADGTAVCKWPGGDTAMEVSLDDRAVAALQRYSEAMRAWRTSGLVSSHSTKRPSLRAADATAPPAPVAPDSMAEEERAYRVRGRARELFGASAPTWDSVVMDGFGIGGVTSNAGATLLSFNEDASGFHADARGMLMRRWNALGELTFVSPMFVEDDLEGLAAVPPDAPPPANGRPTTAPRTQSSMSTASVKPHKSDPSESAAATARRDFSKKRRPPPPTGEDELALRQALLADMYPTGNFDRIAELAEGLDGRSYFATATACGFIIGRHMAVLYDLVVHQMKLYLACQAFRYELVVASATGTSMQDEEAAAGGAAGAAAGDDDSPRPDPGDDASRVTGDAEAPGAASGALPTAPEA